MKKHLSATLAAALLLAFTAGAMALGVVQGPEDAKNRLAAAGYAEIRDLEFDDGIWQADVRLADGRWHDVALDPTTGELIDDRSGRPILDSQQVIAKLSAAGFRDFRDMDLEDGIWEVDATRQDGARVELRINGHTGAVMVERLDD